MPDLIRVRKILPRVATKEQTLNRMVHPVTVNTAPYIWEPQFDGKTDEAVR